MTRKDWLKQKKIVGTSKISLKLDKVGFKLQKLAYPYSHSRVELQFNIDEWKYMAEQMESILCKKAELEKTYHLL